MADDSDDLAVPHGSSTMTEKTIDDPSPVLKSTVLYDDDFNALRDHFLMTGKGRRPSLPPITAVSNRLLAQLCLLRDIENSPWKTVTSWFCKLFPASDMTKGKLEYRCKKAMDTLMSTDDSNIIEFLDKTFPEDELPESLTSFGLTTSVLKETKPEQFCENSISDTPVTNSVVISLEKFAKKEGLPSNFVTLWLVALCRFALSQTQMRHRVAQICKKDKQLKCKKDEAMYESFLNEELLSSYKGKEESAGNCKNVKTNESESHEVKQLRKAMDKQTKVLESAQIQIGELTMKNEFLREERDCLRKKPSTESKQQQNASCQTGFKWNVEMQRMHQKIEDGRKIIEDLQTDKERLKVERDTLTNKLIYFEQEVIRLKRQVKAEQTKKSNFKKQLEDAYIFSEVLLDLDDEETGKARESNIDLKRKSKFKNAFSDDVHLTYMALQGEGNVSASNCSKVINIISKHMYKNEIPIKDLPCIQTALNMSAEGHYLSKHQAAECILSCNHYMLGTDGTSREKKNFIERHIVLSDGNILSLGFTQVISDNASTLLEKTIELCQELCDIYCKDSDADRELIFKEIISKMKCLMSDRAAVMKLFNKKLAAYRKEVVGEDVQTHFLYCNAHFLLGISNDAEKVIKEIEDEMTGDSSVKLGRDKNPGAFSRFSSSTESAACRLIRTAADVFGPRGDNKNGCRNDWISFLEESLGLKSKFCSYRTNRFNNLFENASAVLYHRHHIVRFLGKLASHSNLKLQSILLDVQDENIMAIISALCSFNNLFTFPYWQLINSSKSYGDFPAYVKRMEIFLRGTPDTSDSPVFPEFSKPSSEHVTSTELVEKVFSKLSSATLQVLERQLEDFLHDGVFSGELPTDVKDVLKTCPLSNLIGEQLFGDLDFDMVKRRRASLHLRSSINMWKHNKTGHWFSGKNEEESSRLMSLARKHGGELQKQSKEAEKEIRRKIKENLEENERMKKEKELKERQRHLEIVNAIIDQGGLCMTKEDVDELMNGKNKLENLKAQIRYRKVVLNEKNLNISGNSHELYKALIEHLGYEPTSPPPKKKPRTE